MASNPISKTLRLISVALICHFVFATSTQAGIITGVVGLTKTRVSGTTAGDFSSKGLGWIIGGLVNLTTSIGTGLETGLLFGRRKITQSASVDSRLPQTLDIEVTYVEVPVEYLWRLSRMFFLGTGVYYLHYFGGDYKAYLSTDPSTGAANSFTLSPDDFGGLVSLGGEFPIGSQTALRAEIRYNAGFLPAHHGQEGVGLLGVSYRF